MEVILSIQNEWLTVKRMCCLVTDDSYVNMPYWIPLIIIYIIEHKGIFNPVCNLIKIIVWDCAHPDHYDFENLIGDCF